MVALKTSEAASSSLCQNLFVNKGISSGTICNSNQLAKKKETICEKVHQSKDSDNKHERSDTSLRDDVTNTNVQIGTVNHRSVPVALRLFVHLYRRCQYGISVPVPKFIDIHYHAKITATSNSCNQAIVDTSKVRRKLRQMEISFTIICALFFACIDYFTAFLISQFIPALSVPFDKELRMISGSITTIFHSVILTALLSITFYYNSVNISTTPTAVSVSNAIEPKTEITKTKKLSWFHSYVPSTTISSHHEEWWKDAANGLLQLCTGYMFYDAIVQFGLDRIFYHNWTWRNVDLLFLGHHGATALYMVSTRLVQAGHLSAMILMLTGEITAPMMNLLRISFTIREYVAQYSGKEIKELSRVYWLTEIMHPHLEYWFSALYFVARGILGPIIEIHLMYDLLMTSRGRQNVPILLSLLWMGLVLSVQLGSTAWILNCWKIITTGSGGILQ